MSKMAEVSPENAKILANDYLCQLLDLSKSLEITLKGTTVNGEDKEDIISEIEHIISEYKYWSNLYV